MVSSGIVRLRRKRLGHVTTTVSSESSFFFSSGSVASSFTEYSRIAEVERSLRTAGITEEAVSEVEAVSAVQ